MSALIYGYYICIIITIMIAVALTLKTKKYNYNHIIITRSLNKNTSGIHTSNRLNVTSELGPIIIGYELMHLVFVFIPETNYPSLIRDNYILLLLGQHFRLLPIPHLRGMNIQTHRSLCCQLAPMNTPLDG